MLYVTAPRPWLNDLRAEGAVYQKVFALCRLWRTGYLWRRWIATRWRGPCITRSTWLQQFRCRWNGAGPTTSSASLTPAATRARRATCRTSSTRTLFPPTRTTRWTATPSDGVFSAECRWTMRRVSAFCETLFSWQFCWNDVFNGWEFIKSFVLFCQQQQEQQQQRIFEGVRSCLASKLRRFPNTSQKVRQFLTHFLSWELTRVKTQKFVLIRETSAFARERARLFCTSAAGAQLLVSDIYMLCSQSVSWSLLHFSDLTKIGWDQRWCCSSRCRGCWVCNATARVPNWVSMDAKQIFLLQLLICSEPRAMDWCWQEETRGFRFNYTEWIEL